MASRIVSKIKANKIPIFIAGFIIVCLLVPVLSKVANETRGYNAVGGEVLLPLLYLLVAALIREIEGYGKQSPERRAKRKRPSLRR